MILKKKYKSHNVDYTFLNINSLKDINKGLRTLDSIIKGQEVVFHCHMFHALFIAVMYKIFYRKVPIVFTLHTNKVNQLYRKLFFWLTKRARYADIIFSEKSEKWYLKNSFVIPNGIDLSKFTYCSQRRADIKKPFTFLFLGRLTEPKNPLFVVELVNMLIKNGYTQFKIDIVGDGYLKDELIQKIEKVWPSQKSLYFMVFR